MRILIITTHMNMGGIASYCLTQVRALRGRPASQGQVGAGGHKIIVASSGGDCVGLLEKEGARHIRIDINTKSELSPKIIVSLFQLLPVIRRENVDIIHAHTRVTQVLARLISSITKVPYVTTCHGYFKPRLGRRLFDCWGDKVVAVSDAVQRHLVDDMGVEDGRVRLIYTGIELERFGRRYSEAEKEDIREEYGIGRGPVIGMIGRLSPVKGQDVLVEAAPVILKGFPNAQFLLIGDGPSEKSLKRRVDELGIGERFVFVRNVADTKEPLSVIDIFAFPSIKEGLGLALIEALACGRPCVASDTGGISDVIKNGRSGIMVPPGDSQALADAIMRVLRDGVLRAELQSNAGGAVTRFSIEEMAGRLGALYDEVISARRRRILIVNVNWLGDVIFSGPFLRALRSRYPNAFIACMAVPRCRELLELNPRIDRLIIYDEEGAEKGIFGKMRFIRILAGMRFDTAVLVHRSATRALITAVACIRERVGYYTLKRGLFLTKGIEPPCDPLRDTSCHRVDYFLGLAGALDADTSNKDYEFFISDADRKAAEKVLKESGVTFGRPIAAFNPGGNWGPKRWPAANFAALGDGIADKYDCDIIITGAANDAELAGHIAALMRNKPIILCGRTTIRRLAGVFERVALVVSGDSGPMHIAVAVGANVIAIFGPTSPAVTGPYGRGKYTVLRGDVTCDIPCYDASCRDNRCMKAVNPHVVLKAIEELGVLN